MAGILKVDDLRGNTAAGDITITSEGGSATMQLQQGLVKMNRSFVQSSATVQDSFNISSLSDLGTGRTTANYSNNFSHNNHPLNATSNWDGVLSHDTYGTSSNEIRGRNGNSGSLADRGHCHLIGSGELA